MDGVNVISWMWGSKYNPRDVQRLANAVQKNLRARHRFYLFSDLPYSISGVETREIQDPNLTDRSCFCRLRMFDRQWQVRNGFHKGPILSLDLDLMVLKPIDDLLVTTSSFKILQGVNAVNPNPFNASVMLLHAGHHHEVWDDFSLEKAKAVPFHEFPDDQGWIWHKLPNADGWRAGAESGIYGFQKPGWPMRPTGMILPQDARIVSFIGKRKPAMYLGVPWIREYWKV